MIRILNKYVSLFAMLSVSVFAYATGTYQEPSDFIEEVFSEDVPEISRIWIKKDLKEKIYAVMGHDLGVLRLKYWKKNKRTIWILEEIGKERLITAGFVVNDNRIESVKILAFRESRGWEVRYPFFTDQFYNAALTKKGQLDKSIDGISGATLSVNAMKKMARLALLLHQYTEDKVN